MITIQVRLPDETLAGAIEAASKHSLSLDDYIDLRLRAVDSIPTAASASTDDVDSVEQLARSLFRAVIDYPEDGHPFLIEDVYKQLDLSPWEERGVGTRIRLGKAFMRLVKAQYEGGTMRDDGIQVRVDVAGKTAQNQQLYRLVRVG